MENQESDINPKNNPQTPKQPSAKSKKKRRVRRWIYWLSGIFIILFIVIPLLVNIFADRIFGETAREVIRHETNGKYDFDYGDISYNLFGNDLKIKELVFVPDSIYQDSISHETGMPGEFIELQADELHIKVAGLLTVFFYRELTVEEFYLENPCVKLFTPAIETDTTPLLNDTVAQKFDHRKLYDYVKDYLTFLNIDQFEIKEGSFKLQHIGAKYDEVIVIDNFSISIRNFHLDSLAHLQSEKLFFSDSIGVSIKDGKFDFKEKKQEIAFGAINISSSTKSLELIDVFVHKDSLMNQAGHESLFDIAVPKLTFSGIDFVSALNGTFIAGELLIDRPSINMSLADKTKSVKKQSNIQLDIFNQVTALFYPVDVEKISIAHASVQLNNFQTETLESFKLADLSFDFYKLRIDSSFLTSPGPLYFFEDMSISLANQTFVLNKPEQGISFDLLNFDTRTSSLNIDHLKIDALNPEAHRTNIAMELPSLNIRGHNFKKDIADRSINLSLVELNKANILLELNPQVEAKNEKIDISKLYEYIKGIAKELAIDDFRIVDAGIRFDNGGGYFEEQFHVASFNLEINNFELSDSTGQTEGKIFYSSAIGLDIEELTIKLPDSVHQVNFDKLLVDTKTGTFELDGMHIDTLKTITGSSFINKNRLDVDIENFLATEVDFLGLYNREQVDVGRLSISNPHVLIYKLPTSARDTGQFDPGFLKNYFVRSIGINGLDVVIQETAEDRKLLEIKDASLIASEVRPVSTTEFAEFVADSLELSLETLFVQLPGSRQVIETDDVVISRDNSLLKISNFQFYPGDFSVDKFKKGFALIIPSIDLSGFEIDRAMYHNELVAHNMIIDHPLLRVVDAKSEKAVPTQTFDADQLKGQLLKIFDKWDMQHVEFKHSGVEVYSGTTYKSEIVRAEDFTININDLFLDPGTIMTEDNVMFARDINFTLNSPVVFRGKNNNLIAIQSFKLSTKDGRIIANEFQLTESTGNTLGNQEEAMFGFDDLDVTGIDFFELISNRKLHIDKISLESPVFLLKRKYSAPATDTTNGSAQKINLHQLISKHLLLAKVGDLEVNNASLKISNKQSKDASAFLVHRVDADFRNIVIDSTNKVFENRFLYSDDFDLNIVDYTYQTGNGLYQLGASNINFSSEESLLMIDSGYMKPLIGRDAFAKKVGVQTDQFDWTFKEARLENFRLYDLFFHNYFWADQFTLSGFRGQDYRDKSYERPKNHYPNLPVKGLKSLNIGIRLDTLKIVDSYFKYLEYVKPATQPGEIWFDNISVEARNITNDMDLISIKPDMGFDIRTQLMGKGKLIVSLNFDLQSEDNWRADAVLNTMDLTEMNRLLEHIAFVKVKKGQNKLLQFNFQADGDVARGKMAFQYNNLAIRLIDKKTLTEKSFGPSVASFIANTFVVRSKNPNWGGLNMKEGTIYFQRDKTKSYFNYLAKSALSGVSSTIRGGNEERKEKRIKKKEEKKQKRESGQ